jgi:hypothetical protein
LAQELGLAPGEVLFLVLAELLLGHPATNLARRVHRI